MTVMKMIAFLIATLVITAGVTTYKSELAKTEQLAVVSHNSEIQLAQTLKNVELKKAEAIKAEQAKIEEAQKLAQVQAEASKPPSTPASSSASCRDAIAQTWPLALRDGATTVLVHENRAEDPSAKGSVNRDGSRDYGCFQINDKAHPAFFATQDWSDPVANARYALTIYQGRGNWTAWYAVQGILW